MSTDYAVYIAAAKRLLVEFQALEETLRVLVGSVYEVRHRKHPHRKQRTRVGLEDCSLSELITHYETEFRSKKKDEQLRSFLPWRNYCAHRAFVLRPSLRDDVALLKDEAEQMNLVYRDLRELWMTDTLHRLLVRQADALSMDVSELRELHAPKVPHRPAAKKTPPTPPTGPKSSLPPPDEPVRKNRWWHWPLVSSQWALKLVGFAAVIATFVTFSPELMERWRALTLPETFERESYLIPANLPSPPLPNGCGQNWRPVPGAVVVLAGNSVFRITERGTRRPILRINQRPVVEIELTSDGLLRIWAEATNDDGVIVARIGNDADWVVPHHVSPVRRSNSQLKVDARNGTELLYVHYVNDRFIHIRGSFYVPGSRVGRVWITDGGTFAGQTAFDGGGCSDDSGGLSF